MAQGYHKDGTPIHLGRVGTRKGLKNTVLHRERQSASITGWTKRRSPEEILRWKENLSLASKKLWRSEEFRKKFSKARTGYKETEEHKTRVGSGVSTSPKWRAAMQSKEFREKMRLCHLGDTNPSKRPEVRQKMKDRKKEFYSKGGHPWNYGKEFLAVRGLKNGIFTKPHSYKKGSFFSKKNNKTISYRSSYELVDMQSAERDATVLKYDYEPFAVEFINSKGEKRHVVPDFVRYYKDGTKELREVKALWKIEKNWKDTLAKLEACRKYAKKHGMTFKVITQKDLKITKRGRRY
jgi:hypothetical protein